MRISGKQQSGIFVRRKVEKQLEATMIPVERSIFPVRIPVECSYSQIIERMSECENHYGLTRQGQQIQLALRVEASDLAVAREIFLPQDDRNTDENRHVAPRTFWSFSQHIMRSSHCPGNVQVERGSGDETVGDSACSRKSVTEANAGLWLQRELNLPQGKAFITPSEGHRDRDEEEKPRTAWERLDRDGQTTSSTPDAWFGKTFTSKATTLAGPSPSANYQTAGWCSSGKWVTNKACKGDPGTGECGQRGPTLSP